MKPTPVLLEKKIRVDVNILSKRNHIRKKFLNGIFFVTFYSSFCFFVLKLSNHTYRSDLVRRFYVCLSCLP